MNDFSDISMPGHRPGNTAKGDFMIPGYVLTNFFVYALVNAFTPGPGNILALNTVTNYGWKKGRPLFWGIFAGYYAVQIAVFVYGVGAFSSACTAGHEVYRGCVYSLACDTYRHQQA